MMNDDVKDVGLVAMLSSILGGNKRADFFAPPPIESLPETPPEIPPTAPPPELEPAEPPVADAEPARPDDEVSAEPVAPAVKIAMTPDGKQLLPADAIATLVLGELRKLEGFPESGVSVTVYGYRNWNAMLTFAPFSTNFHNATRFRQAMPDLVFKLRRFVELEV